MNKNIGLALITILLSVLTPLRAADEKRPTVPNDAAEFADAVLKVADQISDRYFIEIPKGQLIEWTVRGLYHRQGASELPAAIEERLRSVGAMKEDEYRDLLTTVRKDVETLDSLGGSLYFGMAKMSNERYIDLALEAMVNHLDGRTEIHYSMARFISDPIPNWAGIDVRLGFNRAAGLPQVITPLFGGQAYEKGIQTGDLITQITLEQNAFGKPYSTPKIIPTKGMTLSAVLALLSGQAGTPVRLTVLRLGEKNAKEYLLTRKHAPYETVLGCKRKKDDHWEYWIDGNKKIAYIRLPTFGEDTGDELEKLINALEQEHLKGLILDLRFNKIGLLLNGAGAIADLFIDDGVIVSIRGRGRTIDTIKGKHEGSHLDFPIVCLVNRETASAGEVVAACLQDHRRAVVMGERTQGECGVHNFMSLDKAMLRLTTSTFYRPSGKKLDKVYVPDVDDNEWGVSPEPKYTLKLSSEERKKLEDHLDRQTFIVAKEQSGKATEPGFVDRQLEMALKDLRARGE